MDSREIDLLIIRQLTRQTSGEEEATLHAWLSESEENRRTFRAMKDACDLGCFETDLKESRTDAEWQKLLRRIRPETTRRTRLLRTAMRYAAIFILGAMCMKLADRQEDSPREEMPMVTRVETGRSERTRVYLPDSSVVWLNACSSISYDRTFGDRQRRIELRGEAFFEVRPDASRPFLVSTDDLHIRVMGTSFNVYAFDGENTASLVLEKGSILFEHDGLSVNLSPGELVEFDKTTHKAIRKKVNTDFYTRWRAGELMFEQMSFLELALRLERNFNVTFIFENEKVKNVTFGGTFRHYDSLATIMKVISAGTPIQYRIEKDTVYIR